MNCLPVVMRDAVIDLADRLQCPPDYLAVAMLSAAGAVIGNKVGIFPYANDESWEVYPALWGGIVGDPGTKKTPSLLHAHKPLHHLESQAAQKHASDMHAYKQALLQHEKAVAAWSKDKSGGFKPIAPPEPIRTRYIVHDSTYQALGQILADNPRGVLALADELSGLLQSLDTPGQEAARGFYLTGWSGTGGYSFDRVGRGSTTLDRYCLSVSFNLIESRLTLDLRSEAALKMTGSYSAFSCWSNLMLWVLFNLWIERQTMRLSASTSQPLLLFPD